MNASTQIGAAGPTACSMVFSQQDLPAVGFAEVFSIIYHVIAYNHDLDLKAACWAQVLRGSLRASLEASVSASMESLGLELVIFTDGGGWLYFRKMSEQRRLFKEDQQRKKAKCLDVGNSLPSFGFRRRQRTQPRLSTPVSLLLLLRWQSSCSCHLTDS